MTKRVDLIADLLMGAAHADHHYEGSELLLVRELLERFMKVRKLPDWLEWRIGDFKPQHLEVEQAVVKLGISSKEDKRHLLELIVTVHEADDTWDLDEDAYLRRVATALEMPEEDWADLTVQDLEMDRISKLLVPPPLPKS
jgi:uncharacterized tellurite resistance protein B-like protein